ncbi:xanthine dehydrogenase small subunit [Scandinavium sp. NPDC088450]|uniref:xanthine dehydrogenase small subunit n=1 Tax=Scandinavium sp. NPDC088450 TaxID=3364514 RepID=UPI003850567A
MIQFLLNQQPIRLEKIDPNQTVLNWLRRDIRRCGTKEGCASGDCGACTVVVASAQDGKMHYQSTNSCLLLVGQLHGKQLITVEGLADDGQLHPVQQAMACGHASQCGFCTPGIVMSTFAMQKNGAEATTDTVAHHLGGNLCRCTGYRPVVDAALQALASPDEDSFRLQEADTVQALQAINTSHAEESNWFAPETLDELAEIYARHPQARLLAGGTDLNLLITQAHQRFEQVISLQQVSDLQGINSDGTRLEIGAATSLTQCQQQLHHVLPVFSEMLDRFASRQIRNQGTLGGNLANASPIGDCAPALLAMDARLRLRCGSVTREVALSEFFTGYRQTVLTSGEFITHILIDDVTLSRNLRLWKVSKRREDDISTVFGAINLELSDETVTRARVAFGGMAAVPARASMCEAALKGKPFNTETLKLACEALAKDFAPLSDARASSDYRLQVAQNLLKRYFLQHQTVSAVEVSEYVG